MRRSTLILPLLATLATLAACGTGEPVGPSTSLSPSAASTSETSSDTLPPLPAAGVDSTGATTHGDDGGIMIGGGG